ncbi:hypothetical protein PV327_009030 [Microctonus hyperodae]|uniref:Uncharacterized protein n=1 Tax=Microctonus hyperodae TaxID=165561 RepID=A0AA39FSY0_MICHY|nr:hypothetical protein PV327_009030 [Microctonus hyperodae]
MEEIDRSSSYKFYRRVVHRKCTLPEGFLGKIACAIAEALHNSYTHLCQLPQHQFIKSYARYTEILPRKKRIWLDGIASSVPALGIAAQ